MDLTSVDKCKDVVSLTAVVPEPTEPAAATEIGAIRRELALVKANLEAGKASAARLEVEPLVARARRVDYPPLSAEALLASAQAKANSGAPREVSIGEGAEALFEADRGRADSTRADAATNLLLWAREAGRFDEAERWSRIADAALLRAGDEGELKAEWLVAVGLLQNERGRYKDYADSIRQALDIARRAGSDGAKLADIERILAEAQAALGNRDEAERLAQEADDTVVRTLGEDHPLRVLNLLSLGYVAGVAKDYRKGLSYELKAMELAERVAPDSSRLPLSYSNACWYLVCLEDRAGALPYCQKAIDGGLRTYGPDSIDLAYAYTNMADVLVGLHRYEEAIENGQKALAIYEKNHSAIDPNYVQLLTCVGNAQTLTGKRREGLVSLERAVALSAKVEASSAEGQGVLADAYFALAKALSQSGARTARVAELARMAEQMYERVANAEAERAVNNWLAEHHLD
jgi:tetratricopeptide (TPR) repeat protein